MKLEKYLAEIKETVARIEERKKDEESEYRREWFNPYYIGLLTGIYFMSGRDLDISEEDGCKLLEAYREAQGSI